MSKYSPAIGEIKGMFGNFYKTAVASKSASVARDVTKATGNMAMSTGRMAMDAVKSKGVISSGVVGAGIGAAGNVAWSAANGDDDYAHAALKGAALGAFGGAAQKIGRNFHAAGGFRNIASALSGMKNDVSKAMRGANSKTGLAGVYSRASAEGAAYSGFKANRGVMPRGFERERYGDPAHVAAAVDILKHKQAYDLDAISSASLTSKGGRGGSYGYDALPYKNRAAGFKLTGRNSIYDKFIGRL